MWREKVPGCVTYLHHHEPVWRNKTRVSIHTVCWLNPSFRVKSASRGWKTCVSGVLCCWIPAVWEWRHGFIQRGDERSWARWVRSTSALCSRAPVVLQYAEKVSSERARQHHAHAVQINSKWLNQISKELFLLKSDEEPWQCEHNYTVLR